MTSELDIIIRRATAKDANLLSELGARTFQQTFAADNTEEDMAAYLASAFNPAQQTEELADTNSTFFIAEVEGVAAGYAKLTVGPSPPSIQGNETIELVRLYVDRQWLGRRAGELLMGACLDEAERSGCKTIWLGVWERNARAQAFYRKWDFTAVGEHIFQLGSDLQRDILMMRAI